MKTLIFAAAGYNLAETTHMIEIAKEAKAYFNVVFICYGGKFEYLIEKEGFHLVAPEPRLTNQKIEHLYAVNRGEKADDYFTIVELQERVDSELRIYSEYDPVAVVTGWSHGTILSTRIAKIPIVQVIESTWTTEYFEQGLGTWPDAKDGFFCRICGDSYLNHKYNCDVLESKVYTQPFNHIANKYGLELFNNYYELFESEHTLLADIPEFANVKEIHKNRTFIGPIVAKLEGNIPDEIIKLKEAGEKIIYFAMGSTGDPLLIQDMLYAFGEQTYNVIAPIKDMVEKHQLNVPSNVIVTGFLPAHKVNPIADVCVIHGGIGTVLNACLSGTPFVGVGLKPEQEANIECCVRLGFAKRIKKKRLTAEAVLTAIDYLLESKKAKKNIEVFKSKLEKWDAPVLATQYLVKHFGENINK